MLFHGPFRAMATFEASSTEGFAEQIFVTDIIMISIEDIIGVFVEAINRELPESVIVKIGSGSVRLKIREA